MKQLWQTIIKNYCRSFAPTLERSVTVTARRYFTIETANPKVEDNDVVLATKKGGVRIPAVWLRHHCRCEKCFNRLTHQRMIIPSKLTETSTSVQHVNRSETKDDMSWEVIWKDGHVSIVPSKWLENYWGEPLETKGGSRYPKVPETPVLSQLSNAAVLHRDYMDTPEGLCEALENIRNFGLTFIKESPPTKAATDAAISRISHPMNTLYGDFWEFESDLKYADTAYTSDYVHLHTDTTYFTEPAGLQVFHCLKHDGEGGLNSIVDGFQVARELLLTNPRNYEMLQQTCLPWQYIDPGKDHFYNVSPIFQHNVHTGQLECIRHNPHDLAPVNTLSKEKISHFYECLISLSKLIESKAVWFKLQPGTILIFDNWRMLHGRNEFTGSRRLCGAYVSRSDWMSKARVLLGNQGF